MARDDYGSQDDIRDAKSRVMAPAIFLILVGIISIALVGYGATVGLSDFDNQWAIQIKKIEDDNTKTAEQKKEATDFMAKLKDPLKNGLPIVYGIAGLVGILTVFAGWRMMSLYGRGLAMFVSILVMIPCVSGCCLLGIPAGIWSLITLNNAVVRRGFNTVAGGMPRQTDDLEPGFER
ncbi:MAG TPA: hypothetical protein VGJ05_10840 [Fimbriiglobus sp.]|jgi:hypothetical protein